jgi:pilus assembly protein CpaB
MNAKALIPLLAGLGIGGLALVLGVKTLKNARAGQQSTAKVRIWAAREDIPRGTTLKEEMLAEVPYPTDALPKGAFMKKEELVGRVPRLVAPGGLPIVESMLSAPGTRPGICVKPGYRAVAVKIDAGSGVDYHLEPGSFVDVVGSFKINRTGHTETIARTVVENAEVAAVGPRVSPTSGNEGEKKEKERSQAVRAVTLFVKPEQVPKLLLAEQEGKIKLSMRGTQPESAVDGNQFARDVELTGDPAESKAEPASAAGSPLDWLRGLFAKPAAEPPAVAAAAALPPPPPALAGWVLKIYRGNKEEVVQFKSADSNERLAPDTADAAPRPTAAQPAAPQTKPEPSGPVTETEDRATLTEPEEPAE